MELSQDLTRFTENTTIVKFLCSYGGKILPRHTDGKLRYIGGHTRVLAVDRSISFAELMVKLGEFCGSSMHLRCPLPNGDLEILISIKSDEDLANLVEEYARSSSSKIRAVLSPNKSIEVVSPSNSSPTNSIKVMSPSNSSPTSSDVSPSKITVPLAMAQTHISHQIFSRQAGLPVGFPQSRRDSGGRGFYRRPCRLLENSMLLYRGPRCNRCH